MLGELKKIEALRDVQIQQTLDYPTVPITIDRQKAGLSGLDIAAVGRSVLVTTSSSRMVARNYWQDPRSGASYQVQVQVPVQRIGERQREAAVVVLAQVVGDGAELIRTEESVWNTDSHHEALQGAPLAILAANHARPVPLRVNAPPAEIGAKPFRRNRLKSLARKTPYFVECLPRILGALQSFDSLGFSFLGCSCHDFFLFVLARLFCLGK